MAKKTEQIPPIFHKLPWIFPAFQESSATMMRSANLPSDKNIFSFLRTPLLCPHGTLLNAVQTVDGLTVNHEGLSTCPERHSVQTSAGLRRERGRAGFSFRVNWLYEFEQVTFSPALEFSLLIYAVKVFHRLILRFLPALMVSASVYSIFISWGGVGGHSGK